MIHLCVSHLKSNISLKLILVIYLLASPLFISNAFANWVPLAKSIDFAVFTCNNVHLKTVRFYPSNVKIENLVYPKPGNIAKAVITTEKASVVINGGYFTPEIKPIGLIINNNSTLSKIHNTSWWSIFSITDNKPNIALPKHLSIKKRLSFAVQAGPRLIVNNQILSFKESEGQVPRSAIGIDFKGRIIIAMAPLPGLSMKDWALCLKKKFPHGPGCFNAMNLDGGSSSQISIRGNNFKLDEVGLSSVPSFIVIWNK